MEMNKHHMAHAINEDALKQVAGGINDERLLGGPAAPVIGSDGKQYEWTSATSYYCEDFYCKFCGGDFLSGHASYCRATPDSRERCKSCAHFDSASYNGESCCRFRPATKGTTGKKP